jgi:uncharacterized protein (DUF983 family)
MMAGEEGSAFPAFSYLDPSGEAAVTMNENGLPVSVHPGPAEVIAHQDSVLAKRRSGFPGMLWALIRARCPNCRVGQIFRGSVTMNDPCPVCGLIFQREEGYFLGAMYCSYLISSVLLSAFYFIADAVLPTMRGELLMLLVLIPFLPLIPAVFRYSRVMWIYFERTGSPVDESAGAYEKSRIRLREQSGGHAPKARGDAGAP